VVIILVLKKIPLEGYKVHQGRGSQLSFNGIALNPKEQVIAEKVNEMIEYMNAVEEAMGFSLEAVGEKCCSEEHDKELEN